jgi:hypothetical protein
MVYYSLITPEASMAMKKTSSGNSPLRQGAEKSFWTLWIFRSTVAADRDVFLKSDRVFRFFPSGGLAKGQHQKWTWGSTPQAGVGQGWAAPSGGVATLWSGSVSSLVFWKLQ